jgi:Mn-containing catalase
LSPDAGSTKVLTFLLTREISHTNMFMKALDALGKLTDPMFGNIKSDETVDLYFNLSKDGPLARETEIKPMVYRPIRPPHMMLNSMRYKIASDIENRTENATLMQAS